MPCHHKGNAEEFSKITAHLAKYMQEAMYQPLGLECGHKFCADCAFSAVGKGNALGTVRAILDHVDPDSACPECRTKGVYVYAMELKETEKLIKKRCEPSVTALNPTCILAS